MKPIIISITSDRKRSKKFEETFKKNVSQAELLLITIPKYPGHFDKYNIINGYLNDNEFYIYLDSYDVIFQSDLNYEFDFEKLYVASEHMLWNGNSFYRKIFEKYSYLDVLVYQEELCSGTFACNGKTFKKWIEFANMIKNEKYNQPFFNLWAYSQPNIINSKLFGTLYANIDKKIIEKKDGKFYWNYNSELIPIVHGNGSYEKYL